MILLQHVGEARLIFKFGLRERGIMDEKSADAHVPLVSTRSHDCARLNADRDEMLKT